MITTFSRPVPCFFHLRPANWFSGLRDRSTTSGDHLGRLSLFLHASREQAVKPDRPIYLRLLKLSAALPSYHLGLSVHGHALKSGFHADAFVATALVGMLSRCSDVAGARNVFEHMPDRDVALWNAMLSGYAGNGHADRAVALFREMGWCRMMPNSVTLSVLLQACGGIDDRRLARSVHAYLCKHGELADTFLYNSLLACYNRFGDLDVSERLFERLMGRDIVSWNAMISGYTKGGIPGKALETLHILREQFWRPDLVTLETALQACAQIGEEAINGGESIHALLVRLGYPMDVYADNSLLLMYCKCGRMESGWSMFVEMKATNVVSWNIVVSGYVRIGSAEKALSLFKFMRSVESEVSSDLFVSALHAVRLMDGHLKQVMCVHCHIVVLGFGRDDYVTSALIAAYGDSREVKLARSCLDYVGTERSAATVCWNTMLSVYLHHGYHAEAAELFGAMQLRACALDAVTLVNALSLCTQRSDLGMGKSVHGYVIRNKFEPNVFVTTSLLQLYVRCGLLRAACWLFSKTPLRNIVPWNTMIHGCMQNGSPRLSLQLFHLMQQQDCLVPDATSVVGVIEAIAQRGYEEEGDYIHEYVLDAGLVDDEFVVNSLIAMHARFDDLDKARTVFDRVGRPSVVTWNMMMAGYSYGGQSGEAIMFFHLMKLNNEAPDSITLLCLLRSCRGLDSSNCVMWSHAITCKAGYESDVLVATSLVDLYAKCGDLSMARMVFNRMSSKTTISWNSMIQGYGIHGNAEEASRLFLQMQQSGVDPTDVTYLLLISACSHAGDAEKGHHYFDLMTRANSFPPREEHLSSLVDLLGRGGLVKEAYDSLVKMPNDPGVCTWGALLAACRIQGNLEVGLAAAERLFELDPLHCGYKVLLSNMCAEAGRWMDASEMRNQVDKVGHMKLQGRSMVESFSDSTISGSEQASKHFL